MLERSPTKTELEGGILQQIGNTPLVALTGVLAEVPEGVEVLAKCEGFNPGGSVKDRAALSMVQDAHRRGLLRSGSTLLDASSGNTGIALALIAAQLELRLVLCLPANAGPERQRLLRAYGAEVVLTSPLEGTDGAIERAEALAAAHPDWVYLDQYSNPANWRAHLRTTGPEILRQARSITHFVACVGTGGTFTGVGRYLKRAADGVQLVELQPDGPLHGLEGVKHMASARVPSVWDPDLADRRLAVPSEAAFEMVRRLARRGVFVGPSGGAAVWGAVQVARGLKRGRVVTVLPDGGQRYLSVDALWGAA